VKVSPPKSRTFARLQCPTKIDEGFYKETWPAIGLQYRNSGVDSSVNRERRAFEVPGSLPPSSLKDLLTIFLSTAGSGGILNVVNGTGGSSTIANPDVPVTVVSYP